MPSRELEVPAAPAHPPPLPPLTTWSPVPKTRWPGPVLPRRGRSKQCLGRDRGRNQHSTRLVRHDLGLAFGCVVDSSGVGLVVAPLSWPAPNPAAPPKSMFGSGPRRSANSSGPDEELHMAPMHADPSAAQTPKNHSPPEGLLLICANVREVIV